MKPMANRNIPGGRMAKTNPRLNKKKHPANIPKMRPPIMLPTQ